jgi:lipid A ethanolaminephosphotransferase
MLKKKIKLNYFVLVIGFINLLSYHFPLFQFSTNNLNYKSISGSLIVFSLAILIIGLKALFFYILFFISRFVGKIVLVIFFNISAFAVYFINTYSVIIDKKMIGNILNTKFEESSSFFSFAE